jgi:Trypsin
MRSRSMTSVWLAAAAALSAAACVAEDAPDPGADEAPDVAATGQEVVGFRNYANPEIGAIMTGDSINSALVCTGTAISPNVVLTARHCLANANFFYTIEEPLNVRRFTVRERWGSSREDIALLWLHEPVPFTRPIKHTGTVNSTAAIFGFGGNDCAPAPGGGWFPNNGLGVKRIGFFTTEASGRINAPIVCGGDSGGPVIDWNDGLIFGVVVRSTGTQNPNGFGEFTATNRPTVWEDLMFINWIWQSESNAGR